MRLPTSAVPAARVAAPMLALICAVACLSGCGVLQGDAQAAATAAASPPAGAPDPTGPAGATASPSPSASPTGLFAQLPDLGPSMLAQIPANSTQVVEVVGAGADLPTATVVVYQRTAAGWQAGPDWPAHNAVHGWTADKHQGDLRTPIGVFSLTDAGGLLPDPGSKLPYYRSSAFTIGGRGFDGEPLAGSFDYVIAINYNRKAGVSPLDDTYPLGYAKGGGVWFHVDHGGPTHGCVSIPRADMISLLRLLDPAQDPVVVMGDAAALAQ